MRARLLEVATRLFSERGFEAVSTREIAGEAGTTLPSISYHFESKEGLYRAVLSSVATVLADALLPASAAASKALARSEDARPQVLAALHDLLDLHARVMLAARSDYNALIVREQLHPSGALVDLEQTLGQHLLGPVTRLIGVLRGLPPESELVRLQAISLIGRPMVFRIARSAAFRLLQWQALDESRIETIVATFHEEVRLMFDR